VASFTDPLLPEFAILSLVWVLKAPYGMYCKSTTGRISLADGEHGPLWGCWLNDNQYTMTVVISPQQKEYMFPLVVLSLVVF
jgi:hypothetical protein